MAYANGMASTANINVKGKNTLATRKSTSIAVPPKSGNATKNSKTDRTPRSITVAPGHLTFDMSGGAKGAKQPLGRPLDGGVRRHARGRPYSSARDTPVEAQRASQPRRRRSPGLRKRVPAATRPERTVRAP